MPLKAPSPHQVHLPGLLFLPDNTHGNTKQITNERFLAVNYALRKHTGCSYMVSWLPTLMPSVRMAWCRHTMWHASSFGPVVPTKNGFAWAACRTEQVPSPLDLSFLLLQDCHIVAIWLFKPTDSFVPWHNPWTFEGNMRGWRALESGKQILKISFTAVHIRHRKAWEWNSIDPMDTLKLSCHFYREVFIKRENPCYCIS